MFNKLRLLKKTIAMTLLAESHDLAVTGSSSCCFFHSLLTYFDQEWTEASKFISDDIMIQERISLFLKLGQLIWLNFCSGAHFPKPTATYLDLFGLSMTV